MVETGVKSALGSNFENSDLTWPWLLDSELQQLAFLNSFLHSKSLNRH